MSQNKKGVLPILTQHLKSPDRYLRPEAIYSLNRVLYEFLDTLEISEPEINGHPWVVPFLFDQYSRSWHFACVLPHVWDKHSVTCDVTKEILWLLAKMAYKPSWKDFPAKAKLLAGKDFEGANNRTLERVNKIKNCSSAKGEMGEYFGQGFQENECFNNFKTKGGPNKIAKLVGLIDKNGSANEKEIQSLVRDTLLVYHGYCGHRGALLPGVLYRNLCKHEEGEILSRIDGEPENRIDGEHESDKLFRGKVKLITSTNESKEVDYHQTKFDLENDIAIVDDSYLDQWIDLSWPFYLRELLQQQELHGNALPFLMLPIYDTWLGNIGYGGLRGCLLCTFQSEDIRRKFVDGVLKELKPVCEILSAELTMSALATIGSIPIEPPYDLIEHFVRVIVHIQDWEMVRVRSNNETLYCYKRYPKDGDYMNAFVWQPCTMQSKDCDSNCKRNEFLSWEHCKIKTILSNEFIPELSPEEVESFGHINIEFEYPATAAIPKEQPGTGDTHELFKLAVIQRQIEVLRALIPKVRARRAALRSAVSAIMGRNMSHNIGSHVLARYSSAIKHDLDPANKEKTDHRTDFLGYLQRRMDFLAEVATSDKAFWEQPLSLHDAINKLNLKKQQDRIEADEPCSATCSQSPTTPVSLECSRLKTPPEAKKNKPILLSYITGKESLVASVEWGSPSDTGEEKLPQDSYFSCPSGEVGVHALYVILENVIRNSARHAKSSKPVDIYVAVSNELDAKGDDGNLIKLTIIDPRTTLNKGGWVIEQNKLVGIESVTERINKILTKEPFLNEDGSTNPKYWGVREMQICAHYLRVVPLGDIEGKPESLPVLEANPWEYVKDGVTGYYLSYTLYLKRAQLLAYVETSSQSDNIDRDKKLDRDKKFLLRGIKPIYLDKVKKEDNENKESGVDWPKIADESRGYSFLVLEQGIDIPTDPAVRASLPVRTLEIGSDIKDIVTQAVSGEGHPLLWMERLHRSIGETSRDLRNSWKGKPFCGVAVSTGEALPLVAGGASPCANGKAIVIVPKGDSTSAIKPLPPILAAWHGALEKTTIAAAWVDHASMSDFKKINGALKQSGFPPSKEAGDPVRRWVCVEGAYSDSAHTAFLNVELAKDLGWELLAAALPRVVVLDERVQSQWDSTVREIPLHIVWPCMGVWVPEKTACHLDFPSMGECRKFLEKPSKCLDQFPIDFLVIHLTVLERLHNDGSLETLDETLGALINGIKAADNAQIIVVTGRGVPTVAREHGIDHLSRARYLPISALLESLVARPSKLALMRTLWSAGRPAKQVTDKWRNRQ